MYMFYITKNSLFKAFTKLSPTCQLHYNFISIHFAVLRMHGISILQFCVDKINPRSVCVLFVSQLAVEIYAKWTQLHKINESMIQLTPCGIICEIIRVPSDFRRLVSHIKTAGKEIIQVWTNLHKRFL